MSGFALSPAQIPGFLASGVFSFFASTMIAIPFMLDLYRVPSDTFQLFIIADNVIGNRFGSMLAAVHILALTLLGACGTAGLVRARGRALARWAGVSVALLALGLGGLRLAFESIDKPYEGYRHFIERDLLLPQAPVSEASEIPRARRGATLERIRRDELLRVGWLPERLPFVFRNDRGARSWRALRAEPDLRLAVIEGPYYSAKLREFLPRAKLIEIRSLRSFFRAGHEDVDALVGGAETGSAWTLIYAQFSVAVPQPGSLKAPVGCAVARGDPDVVEFLNTWLVLKRRDRTLERLFDYWFQGKEPPEIAAPRWSILHDVLGQERAAPETEGLP